MSEFEKGIIDSCMARLRAMDDERERIQALMKSLGYKKPRKARRRVKHSGMAELDGHRRTRLSVVTQQPVTRDEARQVRDGERLVAAQT